MRISVRDLSRTMNQAGLAQAERRLQFAFTRFASRISQVELVVDDENGPKGGVDIACRIQVGMSGQPDVIVTDKDADIGGCISRAAERAQRGVARAVSRTRQFSRG